MSLMCTPFLRAAELDAPLTECALNISVSMPASNNIPSIQWANCCEETGLCGFTWERNKGWESSSVSWRKDWVIFSYWRRHWTTHKFLSCGKALKKHCADFSRVEAGQKGVQECVPEARTMSGRLVCFAAQQPAGEVCQLETGPFCDGNRCTADQLVKAESLRISSICSDRAVPPEDQSRGMHSTSNSTILENPAVVPCPARIASGLPNSPAQAQEPTEGPSQPTSSSEIAYLAAWKVSGNNTLQLDFLNKLWSCWLQAGATGTAGAIQGILIPFMEGSNPF